MLRDFTWTEKYEEAMSDEHPLAFGREIGHPLSTYTTSGMEGVTQNVYSHVLGEGVERSVMRYVRTKWMAPSKCCGIFFVHWFGQVH